MKRQRHGLGRLTERDADRDERRDVQLVVVVLGPVSRQRADRLDDEDL